LPESTKDIFDIVCYIKKTLLPLQTFIDVILLPQKKYCKLPIEILKYQSFSTNKNSIEWMIISEDATLFNRLYYFNAFFSAIEQMLTITNQTNIDAYKMILKNMEQ